MRHGVGLSTSSDSELITQLLALTPPLEEVDALDWVARWVSASRAVSTEDNDHRLIRDSLLELLVPRLCTGHSPPLQ